MKPIDNDFLNQIYALIIKKINDNNYSRLENLAVIEASLMAGIMFMTGIKSTLLKSSNLKTRKKNILYFRDTIIKHLSDAFDLHMDSFVYGLNQKFEK